MLDFKIDTFIMVCECMNFTKAAEKLNITQPAVSQHIKALEEYYNTKLFSYEGKKMRRTKAGEILLQSAITMKHDEFYLKETLGETEEEKRNLIFGVTLTIGDFVIGKQLAEVIKKYPDMRIRMSVENTQKLLRMIEEGKLDFAIVEGHFAKNEYDSLRFSKENYIAVCGKNYKLADSEKRGKRIEDLCKERLIVREEGSGTREILNRALESRNLVINDFATITQVSSISAIKTLIKENCGITFLYEAAVKEELENGSIKKIALEDFNLQHDFTFIWNKGSIFSERYHEIYHMLKD